MEISYVDADGQLRPEPPHQDYKGLISYSKGFGSWWHHLDSTWLVKTDMTPAAVRKGCKPYLDENGEVLVVDVSGDPAAWTGFGDRGSRWLESNI